MPRIGGQIIGGAHHGTHEDGGADEVSIAGLSGTPAALTTHAALPDVHTYNLMRKNLASQYFWPMPHRISDAQSATGADTLYTSPFIVAEDMTLDELAIQVTGLVDPSNIRLGIYADSTTTPGTPGALVKDCGVVSGATAGVKAITGIAQALTKGLYWLAYVSDAAPTVEVVRLAWSPSGIVITNLDHYNGCCKRSFSYAALPDPWGTIASYEDNWDILFVVKKS